MSIWSSISDAFKSAYHAVAGAAETAYDAVSGAAETAWNFATNVVEHGALSTAEGVDIFADGWEKVFSGDIQNGFNAVGLGMLKAAGMDALNLGPQYEHAIGNAALWSLQQSKLTSSQICFSKYLEGVIEEFGREGIRWDPSMEDPARTGATQLPWINLAC
ncbi:hypothetical protein FFI94_018195 [Rhodococcus sp. KBS0724]|uniref:hypothetical protein n=1 Tax=Rhodococcus sp. KBS0724 TaxID=1179674 RepID=UPI00110D76F4|nr:hypothetical protein [Rhodococcus sp. KBS0724]TSD47862.1 hypothetical protein FFI94_018195 [Rhodococcus sp. KBS0724]